jgi:hypothetical protein
MKKKTFIHLRKNPLFSEEESGVNFNQSKSKSQDQLKSICIA